MYLLIEFQSTIDRYMAVRVATYILLLYQDLIKSKQIGKNELLPPVFPVVLYNGEKRWDSCTQLGELIIDLPGSLKSYKPDCAYLILDEGAYSSSDLEPLKNLVAAIFRLENATSREDIIRVVDHTGNQRLDRDQKHVGTNRIKDDRRMGHAGAYPR